MIILLLCLLSTSNAFTSEIFDFIAQDYVPNSSNEDPQNDNANTQHYHPNNLMDANTNPGLIKYNELLSLLHNEKSNKAVLARIGNKDMIDPVVATFVRGIEDRMRFRRSKEDNNTSNRNVEVPDRSKRSAFKWLKNMFHRETATEYPSTETYTNISRKTQYMNMNSTLTDLIADLTTAIKQLNKNLVNFKVQVFFIRVPADDNEDVKCHKCKRNATRLKRQSDFEEVTKLGDPNVDVNFNDSMEANNTENSGSTQHINESSIVNFKSEVKESEELIDKLKTQVNATDLGINKLILNHTVLSNMTDDTNNKTVNSTQSTLSFTATSDKLDQLKLNKSIDKLNNQSNELNTKSPELNPIESQDLTTNSSTQMRRNYITDVDSLGILKKSMYDRENLLLNIDQAYRDIKEKIQPIKAIKYKYAPQMMYKIGYIIANLDTLEVSLKKLKHKLYMRKDKWDSKKLFNVCRKLNLSRKLVDNVMNYLKRYAVSAQFGLSQ